MVSTEGYALRAVRLAIALIMALSLAACGPAAGPVMPDLVGKQLDVAKSDIKRAGFGGEVEVLGGGLLGVIDESNWLVCEQLPAPGAGVTKSPRLRVDRSCADAATAASEEPSAEPSAKDSSASPSHAPTPGQECDTSDTSDCVFGQTAIYSDTVDEGELRLEITVLAPVKFCPSKDATFFDDFANEKEPQAVNVYFPVTIKNVSAAATLDSSYLFTHATNRDQDESDVLSIVADGFEGTLDLKDLAPGKSVSLKDAWSMSTLDEVQLEISINGLAGYSIDFQE